MRPHRRRTGSARRQDQEKDNYGTKKEQTTKSKKKEDLETDHRSGPAMGLYYEEGPP